MATLVKERTETITIKVCMGNSCFERGNALNLDFLRSYVKENGLNADIQVFGTRCERRCNIGPNVIINGMVIESASPVRLESVLKRYL